MIRAMICPHGRQPSICAICVPILEAELATKKWREEKERKRIQDQEDDFDRISQAAIIGAIL